MFISLQVIPKMARRRVVGGLPQKQGSIHPRGYMLPVYGGCLACYRRSVISQPP